MVDDQLSRFKSSEAMGLDKNWGTKMMDSNMTKYQSIGCIPVPVKQCYSHL